MQKWLRTQDTSDDYQWYDQFVFAKPQNSLKEFTYPKGFFVSHAYPHVVNGYLFQTYFHFTKVTPNGHISIWGNKLLSKDNIGKSKVSSIYFQETLSGGMIL